MSGPLSRRHPFPSDVLLEEDDEAIPWTYYSTQNDIGNSVVPMYTSKGVANKRRKLYRQRKDDLDVRPTSSSNCTESVEWTEEEDLSLCLAVSIHMQHPTAESSENLSDLGGSRSGSLFLRNISRELQKLDISKYLAESFVPSHEHRDVLARFKSSAFRRAFVGFLNRKGQRRQSLLCVGNSESNNACTSSDGGKRSKDDCEQDDKYSSSFSKPEILESGQQEQPLPSHTERNGRENPARKSGEINSSPGSKRSNEPPDRQETDVLQGEQIAQENGSERFQQMCRSSLRLRSKQQSEDRVASTDNEGVPITTRKIQQDFADDSIGRSLSLEKVSNVGLKSQPRAETDEQKKCKLRNKKLPVKMKQTAKASNGKLENQERGKRHKESSSRSETAELQQPSSRVLVKMDTEFKSKKTNKINYENEYKDKTTPRQAKESIGSKQEDIKVTKSPLQLTSSAKAPLLATVRPLRRAQNDKDHEKKSFKRFRKKLSDRCLEAQHSGLGLTARLPDHRTSKMSNVRSSLDEYLTMQQSRKNILDACLMAQRDKS